MKDDPLKKLIVTSEEAEDIRGINTVLKTLKEKDWGKKDSVEYKTTAVLLASAFVGGFAKQIARVTGYDIKFVKRIENKARENKIWTKDGKVHTDWMDEKTGGVALACDTAVCMGWLKRSNDAKDLGSKGGKARANRLSPARRKEIATKASHSRKVLKENKL